MNRKNRLLTLVCIGLILSINVYLLLSGSEYLTRFLTGYKVLPIGTVVAWTLFIGLTFGVKIFFQGKLKPLCRFLIHCSVVMALLWGFVSRLLAGNWNFIFTSEIKYHELRFDVFKYYSLSIIVLIAISVLSRLMNKLFRQRTK